MHFVPPLKKWGWIGWNKILHKRDEYAASIIQRCLVYILNQVISQQLIKALDVQSKAIRVAA
jgi:hypothetical protein